MYTPRPSSATQAPISIAVPVHDRRAELAKASVALPTVSPAAARVTPTAPKTTTPQHTTKR